jgi:hypothetical protein
MFVAEFVPWGAQDVLMTAKCAACGDVVTLTSLADGTVDLTGTPIGQALHGTTRDERERETLASRPHLEAPSPTSV